MERLTEKNVPCSVSSKRKYDGKHEQYYYKLREYEDLEEAGLLKRFPCKIGDVAFRLIYCWGSGWDIIEDEIKGITFKFDKIYLIYSDGIIFREIGYDEDKIKFTREEAEKRLEEIKQEDKYERR